MTPDARRKAIVDAVTPLLVEMDPSGLTTVKIAEAAGVAEGTIFRVFHDKAELLYEACRSSLDPAPDVGALGAIETDLPFEIKLRKAAAILVKRAERIYALSGVIRSLPAPDKSHEDAHAAAREANSMIYRRLVSLFTDHVDELAVDPEQAAAAFRGLLYAVSFPLNDPTEMVTVDEAIEILCNGILAKETDR